MTEQKWQTFDFDLFDLGIVAVIKLHPDVINQVDEEWRSKFYNLDTPREIARHIVYNKIINNWGLSHLDGFANFPDEYAKVEII